MGEMKDELGDLTIEIKLDAKKKTITISDKGIGMSADEIKKYINQIAFSGETPKALQNHVITNTEKTCLE